MGLALFAEIGERLDKALYPHMSGTVDKYTTRLLQRKFLRLTFDEIEYAWKNERKIEKIDAKGSGSHEGSPTSLLSGISNTLNDVRAMHRSANCQGRCF